MKQRRELLLVEYFGNKNHKGGHFVNILFNYLWWLRLHRVQDDNWLFVIKFRNQSIHLVIFCGYKIQKSLWINFSRHFRQFGSILFFPLSDWICYAPIFWSGGVQKSSLLIIVYQILFPSPYFMNIIFIFIFQKDKSEVHNG